MSDQEREVLAAAERPHHPTSPSSLSLREQCPCYESRGGTSEAAERGTLQHTAVELGEDQEFLMDHEALAVADCLEFCEQLVEDKYGGEPGHHLVEPELNIDTRMVVLHGASKEEKHVFKGTTSGYCDRAIVSKDETFADIIDWKFGMFEVTDAEENIQGMSYLLGLVRKFKKLQRVTVNFIAPHRDEWTFHTFEREEFDWLFLRVVTAVKRAVKAKNLVANGDWSMATPSTTACLFCKYANGECPALTSKCIELGMKRSPLEFPADIDFEMVNDPKNAGIGMRLASVVKGWAESYKSFMGNKAVDEADFIPEGYILVTASRRGVTSVAGVREVAKKHGLTDEEVDATTDVALGKLEKLIMAKTPRGSKTSAKDEFSHELEEAGYVEEGIPYSFLKLSAGVKKSKQQTEE